MRALFDLDLRTRLLISMVVSGVTIYLSGTPHLLCACAISLVYLLLSTNRYKVVCYAFVAIACMMLFTIALTWGTFFIVDQFVTEGSKAANVIAKFKTSMVSGFHTPFLRMIPSLNVLLAIALNFSVQKFVSAMKSIHLPRVIFLPLMVFCRFVPEFIDVIRQLRDAVRMRGFSVGLGAALIHPLQSLRLSVIPLTVRTLRMADHLAVAAEMKRVGYAKHPTALRVQHFHAIDGVVLAFTVILSCAIAFWQFQVPATPYGPHATQGDEK